LKPHPDFPRQEKIAVHKPLLSDLLEATEAYGKQKGKQLNYNIEIKSNPENDGKKHPEVSEFVDLAIKVIKEKGIFNRATIQSFDPRSLQYLHKIYPDAITSLLIEDSDHRPFEEQILELGFTPSAYSPHFSLVTPELVKKCHDKKILLIPWTINNVDEMRKQIKLGVDGIISDYPDLFSQL
jgi:glycerophosphoryl diester phosphodiesterase